VDAPADDSPVVGRRDRAAGGDRPRHSPAALEADVFLFLVANILEDISVEITATTSARMNENRRVRRSHCHRYSPLQLAQFASSCSSSWAGRERLPQSRCDIVNHDAANFQHISYHSCSLLLIGRAISRPGKPWLTIDKAHISSKAMRTNEIFQTRETTDKQKPASATLTKKVCRLVAVLNCVTEPN
jgi:hypothetical protein